MSKLDGLKKRERDLLYQLEDNGKEKYRTKELIETFEGYDRASHRYQSDLDSVNLIGRMQEGQSYDQAISSYYADLQKDSSQREREFLKNKDWKKVRGTIYSSLVPADILKKGEVSIKEYIEKKYPDVSTFLNRLETVAD